MPPASEKQEFRANAIKTERSQDGTTPSAAFDDNKLRVDGKAAPLLTRKLILGRVRHLMERGQQEEFNNPTPFTAEFLTASASIYANEGFGNSFKLDDLELYQSFAETLEKISQQNTSKNISHDKIILHAVAITLYQYFGSPRPGVGASQRRMAIYDAATDSNDGGSETISITAFKGLDATECAERAAVAHNLLVSAGMESIIFTCNTIQAGGGSTPHLAIFLSSSAAWELYDPTNPQMVYETPARERIIQFRSSRFEISRSEAEQLLTGNGTVTVNYQHSVMANDGIKNLGSPLELEYSAQARPLGFDEFAKRLLLLH